MKGDGFQVVPPPCGAAQPQQQQQKQLLRWACSLIVIITLLLLPTMGGARLRLLTIGRAVCPEFSRGSSIYVCHITLGKKVQTPVPFSGETTPKRHGRRHS
ncbi:hypothetical protein NKR23_g10656 [Pleurostoma richardsiae]|uniref:Uncharacterized protein n=1 Tax=Pleurostoma richardsiae TaxID=41990 RepID=A0AA38R2J2_9PEZI|nr:hypothetical protein NKR23_g10656 [Pleurostoma richardsiae]